MKLSIEGIEESSSHYYIPQTADDKSYLYNVLSTGYFECKPSYRVERSNFNSFLIIAMLSGSLSYTSLYNRGIACAGQVLLLDCHNPHSYRANGKCTFLFFHFSGAQSSEICSSIISELGNVLHLPSSVGICETISELINCMADVSRIDRPRASQMVYSILMQLLTANPVNSEGSTGDPLIDQALAFIHQHLSEKITVEDIAASIGYNESYFSQKFCRATGKTPYQFLLHSRLDRAQLLLKTTALSIREISEQTGFNSAAHFSYAFRKEQGCTPHEYRERPA